MKHTAKSVSDPHNQRALRAQRVAKVQAKPDHKRPMNKAQLQRYLRDER
jgi:hypothetical protein